MTQIGETRQLVDFIKEYRLAILLSVCFAAAAYGFMLTHYNLTIDEETWINNTSGSLEWLSQGRFGMWLNNLLLSPGGSYVPILWDWLAVLLWSLCAPIMLYTIKGYFPNLKKIYVFFFCAYFSCVPFVTGELLSYSMQNLHMSIAMWSVVLACWFSMLYRKSGKKKFLVPAVLLLVYSISLYQSFITVYVTWCCACLLLDILNKQQESPGGYRRDYRRLLCFALAGLAAIVIYAVINSLLNHFLLPSSGYLTQTYVGWNQGGNILTTLFMIFANVVRVSFAIDIMDHPIYAGIAICVTTCAFIIAMLYSIVKAKDSKQKKHIFLSALLLFIAPFSLFIALGSYNTPGRSLVALAFLGAVQWLIILSVSSNKIYKGIVSAVMLIVLAYNAVAMNRLFYDSHRVYLCDQRMAEEVVDVIGEKGYDYNGKPLVFIGMYDTHAGEDYVISGSTGGSFFSWDDGNISRMINFMAAEGYDVLQPDVEEIESALAGSQRLPEWPDAGSVVDTPQYIVVKLSEPTDRWYEVNGVGR